MKRREFLSLFITCLKYNFVMLPEWHIYWEYGIKGIIKGIIKTTYISTHMHAMHATPMILSHKSEVKILQTMVISQRYRVHCRGADIVL